VRIAIILSTEPRMARWMITGRFRSSESAPLGRVKGREGGGKEGGRKGKGEREGGRAGREREGGNKEREWDIIEK